MLKYKSHHLTKSGNDEHVILSVLILIVLYDHYEFFNNFNILDIIPINLSPGVRQCRGSRRKLTPWEREAFKNKKVNEEKHYQKIKQEQVKEEPIDNY